MPSSYVPDEDSVVRHCPSQLCIWEGEVIVGVFPQAFELRKDLGEEYLSTSWLEYFPGSRTERLRSTVKALSAMRTVRKRHGMAIGNVAMIKSACNSFGLRIRIVNEPKDLNPAYAAIRRYKSDDLSLLDLLATSAWAEVVTAGDFL